MVKIILNIALAVFLICFYEGFRKVYKQLQIDEVIRKIIRIDKGNTASVTDFVAG